MSGAVLLSFSSESILINVIRTVQLELLPKDKLSGPD